MPDLPGTAVVALVLLLWVFAALVSSALVYRWLRAYDVRRRLDVKHTMLKGLLIEAELRRDLPSVHRVLRQLDNLTLAGAALETGRARR